MILELLDNGAASHPAIAAEGGPIVTYAGLRAQIDRLARELCSFGLGRGDRIAIALPNGLEMIASFFAAAVAGTAAPLNPAYKQEEFRFYLEDTKARALILPPTGLDEARQAAGPDTLIIETDVDSDGNVRFSAKDKAGPPRKLEPVANARL